MNDEQEQPIQPATPEPVYEPAPRRKKPIVLGLVFAILIVIIGIGIILYYRGIIVLPGRPIPLPKVMEKIKNGETKCIGSADKEKCLRELTVDEAVAGRQAEACEKIDKQDLKDSCFDAIARELGKGEICVKISFVAARDECVDSILFTEVKKNLDISVCAKMVSAKWQNACYEFVFKRKGTIEYCNTVGERKEECITAVVIREAAGTADPAKCGLILNEDGRILCEEIVNEALGEKTASRDDDADGLSNAEEARYGTNPKNSDTDGDGYKDGDEVKAGYNPKGQGRLQ